MSSTNRKIVSLERLQEIREELRLQQKRVVQCHGCFDIVHPGHIRYLRFARDQGDRLIVSVSGDAFVGKGHDRPYINEDLRAENLAALEFVDWVCIDQNSWAGPVLEAIKPDVYVKGKEYETSTDPRFAREKELVESHGGVVIFSSGEVVYSSTYIIDRWRDRLPFEIEQIRSFCRRHTIDAETLQHLIATFKAKRVLVLGDSVVDRYVHCDVATVAAESPVLNATELAEDSYVGAAGLVAAQCSALGANATFLTAISPSRDSMAYLDRLSEIGVETCVVEDPSRPVFVKTRYLADGIKIFKVNQGRYSPLSTIATRALAKRLEDLAKEHDAVIITDFGYGLLSRNLIEVISRLPSEGTPFYLDVSHAGTASLLRLRNAAAVTPTESELRQALADQESGLSNLAIRYFRQTDARLLAITMGKKGAVVFHPPREGEDRLVSDYLPAFSKHPLDTVGAGDVFLATAALSSMAGGTSAESLFLAMATAGLHVERIGNEAVGLREVLDGLSLRWNLG